MPSSSKAKVPRKIPRAVYNEMGETARWAVDIAVSQGLAIIVDRVKKEDTCRTTTTTPATTEEPYPITEQRLKALSPIERKAFEWGFKHSIAVLVKEASPCPPTKEQPYPITERRLKALTKAEQEIFDWGFKTGCKAHREGRAFERADQREAISDHREGLEVSHSGRTKNMRVGIQRGPCEAH